MVIAFLAVGLLAGLVLGAATFLTGGSLLLALIAYALGGSLTVVVAAVLYIMPGSRRSGEGTIQVSCVAGTPAPPESGMAPITPRRVRPRKPANGTERRGNRTTARKARRNLFSETF